MQAEREFIEEMLPHVAALRAFARRFGGEADDLVQETLVHALQARERYRPGSNARAWLFRILHNIAVTDHRARVRDRRLEARLEAQPHEQVEAAPVEDARLPALKHALTHLSDADRRVVELVDLDGLRYRDAARALGCPIGTVMSRLYRARRRLQLTVESAVSEDSSAERPLRRVA